ncbi:MAG TPA: transposase [Gaiellaceae bacterium]
MTTNSLIAQYNRRLRGLVELISAVQQQLARFLDSGGVRLADGSQVPVANYPGCQQRSHFAGHARYGYAKSQHRFVFGVRLVLLTDRRGLPLGYTIVPANEKEYEPLADLLTGVAAQVVVADKGLWGRAYEQRLAADGVCLLTPDRTRTADNIGRERRLASTRLVIESVFSNLKGQMRLELHLAKTPAGLALRIAQRILALTLGMLLNTLTGRPARVKGAITRVGVVARARLRGSRDVVLVSVPRCPSSVRAAHPLSPRPGPQGCRVAGAPP